MNKLHRTKALCGIMAALCLGSCISTTNELDLNKDISFDMQIGSNGVKIPLGSLKKIYVDSLVNKSKDSVLVALEDGLFGFSKDGEIKKVNVDINDVNINIPAPDIDPITTDFEAPTQDDLSFDIPSDSTTTTLKISSINLSEINEKLPKFDIPKNAELPTEISYANIPINNEEIPVPEQTKQITFSYTLPEDVKQLNTVYFGQEGTTTGQKITLDVDLSGIYNVLNDPVVSIESLDIIFPGNFTLAEDDALSGYLSGGDVSVNGNKFSIESAPVKTMTGSNKKLPISFYLKSADFSEYGSNIDFSGNVRYSLKLKVSGTTKGSGKLSVDVRLKSDLTMADFSVDTNPKEVALNSDSITSSCKVSGLDGMARINSVEFYSDDSYFKLRLSDFDISPFQFDDESYINLVFSNDLTFDKSYSLGDKATWTSDGSNDNILKIYPDKAKGKDIIVHLSSMDINQDVDKLNATITLNTGVAYNAHIGIAGKKDLRASDLEQLGDKEIKFSISGKLAIKEANFVNSEFKTDIDKVTKISINEDVDPALLSLSRVNFKEPAGVTMKIKFNKSLMINDLTLSNFTIVLPDYLKISYTGEPNIYVAEDGHSLVINRVLTGNELTPNGGFTLSGLTIDSLDFKDPIHLDKGKLVLNDQEVKITGSATAGQSVMTLIALQDVTIIPTVTFDQINVSSVTGKVNPKIDPIKESVGLSLGSDADFLKDATFKLSNPKITINLNSTVTVPIKLDLSLTSKEEDGAIIAKNIAPDNGEIYLDPCQVGEENRKTTIILSTSTQDYRNGDTLFVGVSRLPDLMTKVPDSILFRLEAYADTTVQHYVDLTNDLSVSGNYHVSIPMSFQDLFLEYTDTIKDLAKNLEEFGEFVDETEVQLLADVFTTIPLSVKMDAYAIDKKGKKIKDIVIESTVIEPGTDQGIVSPFKLTMNIGKGALGELDGIVFTAQCENDDNAGTSMIKKGQYVELTNVKLFLPHGVTMDLTDKINDKKK